MSPRELEPPAETRLRVHCGTGKSFSNLRTMGNQQPNDLAYPAHLIGGDGSPGGQDEDAPSEHFGDR